jgi:serine/threonine protein kinase
LHGEDTTYATPLTHDDPNNLVRTLRLAAQNPRSFRVLQCEGWYDLNVTYGLVYKLPAMQNDFICETLTNILLKPDYRKLLHGDLENRIKLARALARSLLELHTVDWLHKSFYPDNILFFGEQIQGKIIFDWTKPYLVGFGSSRHQADLSSDSNFRLNWSYKLHNHPDRNNREVHIPYKKLYDIYSLGVVLLELGRGSSLMSDPGNPENAKWDIKVGGQRLRENLIEEAMSLPVVLGSTFRGVVLTCLNDELKSADYDGCLTTEFRMRVCNKLEQIRINV